MRLVKLGKYIELSDLRNSNGALDETAVIGLSTAKQMIKTKADLDGVSLNSYKLLPPHHFAYVPDTSRRGDKMSLGYNTTEQTFLVSSISIVFKVADTKNLNPDYLYMYFNRPEFDRYARFNSWGSAREAFTWSEMCDIAINLPPLPIQRKYVDVYNSMLANQRAYESGLEDINIAIKASIEKFKHTARRVPVGKLLEEIDTRNSDGAITNVQGININKEFMPSVANLSDTDLTKYKIISKNQFAANFMHVMRDEKVPLGLYHKDNPCIISPAYPIFQIKFNDVLAEYIMLWLNRSESDRYAWFISDSSIRGGLEMNRFYEIEIPLPSISQQQAVVNFYNARLLILQNIMTLSNM
jgi:type I restriction enzyme S subunit